jgi:hypothetical protein
MRVRGPFDKKLYMQSYNQIYKAARRLQTSNYNRYYRLRKRFAEKRQLLRDLKENTPCVDCGNSYPHYIMDFDHTRGIKKAKMSELITSSWRTFFEELDKCDIVCANCHKVRTYDRSQS